MAGNAYGWAGLAWAALFIIFAGLFAWEARDRSRK